MFEEVTKKVKTKGMWANEAESIREAVRKALEEDSEANIDGLLWHLHVTPSSPPE